MNIRELAGLLDGALPNDSQDVDVVGINTLRDAAENEVSFLSSVKYKDDLRDSRAAVVLVAADFPEDQSHGKRIIRVADPYMAFATLQRYFNPLPISSSIRHCSAVIDSSATVADSVEIGANVVIGRDVSIAAGTIIEAGCVIEDGVNIGENSLLKSNSVVSHHCVIGDRVILQAGAVIGSDGFGYAWSGEEHLKIPQTGRVILEDDVEIGSNSCIDRGALGDTVIRQGAKLDNLIQIAHNVEIGPCSIIAGQVGIAGSTKLGRGCQMGAQAGIAGHLNIGDGVRMAAKSGVIGDLDAGGVYAGFPAIPHRLWLKVSALILRLPEIWKLVRKVRS